MSRKAQQPTPTPETLRRAAATVSHFAEILEALASAIEAGDVAATAALLEALGPAGRASCSAES